MDNKRKRKQNANARQVGEEAKGRTAPQVGDCLSFCLSDSVGWFAIPQTVPTLLYLLFFFLAITTC